MAKYSLYVREAKNVDTIYIKLSDRTRLENLGTIPKIPEGCISKIYPKGHIKYIANRRTSCRCKVCEVINHNLDRAKRTMTRYNLELIENTTGFGTKKRNQDKWKNLLSDPHSFLNLSLYEGLTFIANTKDGANRKNLNAHARAISFHWENFTKYKIHQLFDNEVQNEWIDVMNRIVILENKVLASTIYAYNKAFRQIGNHYLMDYEDVFANVGITEQPTGTKSKLKTKIFAYKTEEQKTKEKNSEHIRWMTDEEIKTLKENIIGVRDTHTNNFDYTFEHKNKAYNECHRAFLFSITSGLRYNDCQRLQWKHIDSDKKELKINPHKNYKRGSNKIVHQFYSGDQLDILGEPGEPDEFIFPHLKDFKNSDWRHLAQRHLHIKPFTFHNARHTFARHRWNEGKVLSDIAILLADEERTVRHHYHSWDTRIDAERLKM